MKTNDYKATIPFIGISQRFSRQCLENLKGCFPGHIIPFFCRLKIVRLEIGMKMKRIRKAGVSGRFSGMYLLSIIIGCRRRSSRKQ